MSSLLTGINPYGTDLKSNYNRLPLGTGLLAPNINDIKRMSDSVDQEVYKDDLSWVKAAIEGRAPGAYTTDANDEGYDFISSFMNSFSKSPGFGNMTTTVAEAGVNTPTPEPKPLPKGLITEGNLDLNKRPVVPRDDGKISTVNSITVGFDDGFYVIPTVTEEGLLLDNDQAVEYFKKTGKHLGRFYDQETADAFAQQLHLDQEKMYGGQSRSPGFGNMTTTQTDGSSSVQSNAPLPDAVYTATDVKAPLHANVNNNPRWKTPSEDEVKSMLGAENLAEYASKGLDVDSIVRTAQSVVSQQNAFKAYQEDMAKIGAVKNGDKGWKSFAEWSLGKAPVSRKERNDGAGVPASPTPASPAPASPAPDNRVAHDSDTPFGPHITPQPAAPAPAEPTPDNRVAHDSDTPFGPNITPQPAAPVTSMGSGNGAKSRFSKLSNEDLSLIVASPEIKREHRAEAMKEMNTRIQNVAIFNKEDPSLLNGISMKDITNFAKEFYNASTETYDISLGVLLGTLVGSKAFNFAAKDYQSLVSQLGGPQAIALATQAMFKLSVNDKKTFESISNYIKPALKKITGHTNKLNNLYKSTADPTKVGSKTISSVNPHVLNKSYNKALLDLERRSGAIKHLLSDSNLLQKYTQLKAAGRKVMLDQLGKIPYSNIDHVETILLDPKYMRFLDYVKTIMQ